jgi:hypothetical protein
MGSRQLTALLLLAAACAGPDTAIEAVTSAPSPRPGCTRVTVDLLNRGRGHGQVEIQITLRDSTADRTVTAERTVELAEHQRIQLVTDVETPPGSYSVAARAEYPH